MMPFSTSTILLALGHSYNDIGTMVANVIGNMFLGGVALVGLGFGYMHLKRYITGRSF